MVRRIIVLLAAAGIAWYLYVRLRRPEAVYVGDQADLRPDAERGGFAERVTGTTTDAAAAAARAAKGSVDRIRSIIGEHEDEAPEGERVVVPEGDATEDAAAKMAAGYAPADERKEPPPTPDAYRPAADASPLTDTNPEHDDGAAADPAPTRAIKGHIKRDGEKIYHLPGDPAYERTSAQQTFTTVEEAEAAGFRRAGRRRAD